jgi:H+-translocating NAD(P) transhydrogenase subunit alpha
MMLLVLFIILIASALLGYRVISKVPSLLHTPLMSGMNALSGITLLGALAVYAVCLPGARTGAAIALVLAMINVAGGFWVTERMLRMFKKDNHLPEENSL